MKTNWQTEEIFQAEALENRDSLPVSRQRQTDGLFAFGESASAVAGGEEREEGKRPSELRVLPLLANPTAIS